MHVTCPHCDTHYPHALCGVDPTQLAVHQATATVFCSVCKGEFEVAATYSPKTEITYSRWLRRAKETVTHALTLTSTPRT